ncbi:hypothetical protein Tco_1306622, partial [Tanacetum coccineum]
VGKGFSGRETPLFPTMVVQNQAEMGEDSAILTDPHHTPTIIQPSTSQPQNKQRSRRPKRKDTEVGGSARIVSSNEANLGDQEDASKQGRKINDIDKDAEITLVDKTQGRYGDDIMFDVSDIAGEEVKAQDKGKRIMVEEPMKMKKKDQISLDEELAFKLQAEEEEEERLAREKFQRE